jgi:uncharacterized protein
MSLQDQFLQIIHKGYTFEGQHVKLGYGMLSGEVVNGADVLLSLKTMNPRGLIAGATGTGKAKTLQLISEYLSDASVPVLLLDIKEDLSGLAAAGIENDKIAERCKIARLCATVSEFGPVLLSKILGLNDTQGGLLAIIFKYCDDNRLPLLDLKDFIRVLQFVSNEGKSEIEKEYGKISTTSTGTILRKVIELQQQGADIFWRTKFSSR